MGLLLRSSSSQPTKLIQGCTRLLRVVTFRFEIHQTTRLLSLLFSGGTLPAAVHARAVYREPRSISVPLLPSPELRLPGVPAAPPAEAPQRPHQPGLYNSTASNQTQITHNINFRACSQPRPAISPRGDTTLRLRIQDHRRLDLRVARPTASIQTCLLAQQLHRRRHQHRVSSTAPTRTPTLPSQPGGSWDLSLPLVGLISPPLASSSSYIFIGFLSHHQTKLIWAQCQRGRESSNYKITAGLNIG